MPQRIVTTTLGRHILAYVALTAAFVFGLAWLTILNGRTHDLAHRAAHLSQQNSRLIHEFAHFRAIRIKQAIATDIKLCEAVNTITLRDRETFVASGKRTANFLRLLGLPEEQVKKVIAASKLANAEELRRRPLLKCGQLPTVKSSFKP